MSTELAIYLKNACFIAQILAGLSIVTLVIFIINYVAFMSWVDPKQKKTFFIMMTALIALGLMLCFIPSPDYWNYLISNQR